MDPDKSHGVPLAIRAGTPRDANFLAWVLLAASRGHLSRGWFDIALNAAESRCLEFLKHLATTQPPSWWHYSRFLVAAINAQPVAALSAFRAGEAYPLSQAAMSEVAEALALHRQSKRQSGGVAATSFSARWVATTIAGRWRTSQCCGRIAGAV